MSIEVSNNVTVSISIEGQASAANMYNALDYALNNNTNLTAEQRDELSAVRVALATVF